MLLILENILYILQKYSNQFMTKDFKLTTSKIEDNLVTAI